MDLGQFIKDQRLAKGIYHIEMSKAIDYDATHIWEIETGRGLCSIPTILKIALYLDIPIDVIFRFYIDAKVRHMIKKHQEAFNYYKNGDTSITFAYCSESTDGYSMKPNKWPKSASFLRQKRIEKDMTQEQLSERSGISLRGVYTNEKAYEMLSLNRIFIYAESLEFRASHLFSIVLSERVKYYKRHWKRIFKDHQYGVDLKEGNRRKNAFQKKVDCIVNRFERIGLVHDTECGKFIVEYRKKHNLTKRNLGAKVGISTRIKEFENGTCLFTFDVMKKMSEKLNIPIDDLFKINLRDLKVRYIRRHMEKFNRYVSGDYDNIKLLIKFSSDSKMKKRNGKYPQIAGRLLTDRKRLGLLQKDISEKIGCWRSVYSFIERGRQAPGLFVIDGWSQLVGEDFKELFLFVLDELMKVNVNHYKRKWTKFKKENIQPKEETCLVMSS